MKPTQHYYLGVDICKAKLDVFSPSWEQSREFPNTAAGLRRLRDALQAHPGTLHLVCEATGGYERCLVDMAHAAGIKLSVINALRVRSFAQAKGLLAKTDKIDARVLSEFGDLFCPPATPVASALQRTLSSTARRRASLVGQLVREKNALEKASEPFVHKTLRAAITFLKGQIAKCEQHMLELINADEALRAKRQRLEQVKGIGTLTACVLLAELPELGQLSGNQISALTGVAPLNRDSGPRRGQRSIKGGRSQIRHALYMPALCATRYNPVLSQFYNALIARNKPHRVAIIAVMRKLIRLLNHMLAQPSFQVLSTPAILSPS